MAQSTTSSGHRVLCMAELPSPLLSDPHMHRCELDATDPAELVEHRCSCGATWTRTGPRVWELPAEPGPEVTAVRDRDHDLWRRTGGIGWNCGQGWGTWTWISLMVNAGPLTDASDEVTP